MTDGCDTCNSDQVVSFNFYIMRGKKVWQTDFDFPQIMHAKEKFQDAIARYGMVSESI